jgi:protein transport protein SEC61 subunit gamma-like protein
MSSKSGKLSDTIIRLLRMVSRPEPEEYKMMLRVVLIGLGLLGTIGFVFQLMGSFLEFAGLGGISREYVLLGGIIIIVIILVLAVYLRRREEI